MRERLKAESWKEREKREREREREREEREREREERINCFNAKSVFETKERAN